jgi:hypothetical protein
MEERKNMNNYRFSMYIDQINDLFVEHKTRIEALEADVLEKRENVDKRKNYGNVSPGQMAVLNEELMESEQKYRDDIAAAVQEATDKIATMRDNLTADNAAFLAADPGKLDVATMTLLNSGICSSADLERIAAANADNVTVLRLVCREAEKLLDKDAGDETARLLVARIKAFLDPSGRPEVFDQAVVNTHLSGTADLISIAFDVWRDTLYRNFKAEMEKLDFLQLE